MSHDPIFPHENENSGRHRHVLRSILILVLIFGFVPGLYLVERLRGQYAWSAYEREARQRGIKMQFADFVPPPVPDAENVAVNPVMAAVFRASEAGEPVPNPFAMLAVGDRNPPKLCDRVKQTNVDLAAWQDYFIEAKTLGARSENAAEGVLSALGAMAGPMEQLRAAGARTRCRYPVHWEKNFAAELPHLKVLQNASEALALRLSAHLALGNSSAAYQNFHDGLRLATSIREEPAVVSGLVRATIAVKMLDAVWGGLATAKWEDSELRSIEAELAALDWLADYRFAIESERGSANGMVDAVIQNPDLLFGASSMGPENQEGLGILKFYPKGWFYQSKARANRHFDELLARVDPARRRFYGDRPIPSSPAYFKRLPVKMYYAYFSITAPVFESVDKKFVQIASVTDLARLACALERHRLAHGKHPAKLADLSPEFLTTVPAEIVSGEPYCYHPTEDGRFLLYSVGTDLHDDDGVIDPKLSASKQRDWVWRYPAP